MVIFNIFHSANDTRSNFSYYYLINSHYRHNQISHIRDLPNVLRLQLIHLCVHRIFAVTLFTSALPSVSWPRNVTDLGRYKWIHKFIQIMFTFLSLCCACYYVVTWGEFYVNEMVCDWPKMKVNIFPKWVSANCQTKMLSNVRMGKNMSSKLFLILRKEGETVQIIDD